MTTNWSRIGENIVKLRVQEGLTQRQLAIAVGVHRSAINNWETGETKPSRRFRSKLLEVLGPGVLAHACARVKGTDSLAGMMDDVLRMAEDGVIAAGSAAMRYFHPLPASEHSYGSLGNPKLEADAVAHESQLKSVVPDLRHIARRVGCEAVVFGEELAVQPGNPFGDRVGETLEKLPDDERCRYARSGGEFAQLLTGGAEPRLGVISDPIDGSGNLELGLGGQFVSAIAIMDGSELLASAIYDPHGAVLYSAAFHPGAPGVEPTRIARMRHLRAGMVEDLSRDAKFGRRVLSFHASRTARHRRKAMLGQLDRLISQPHNPPSKDLLDRTLFPGGITAINCGQAALASVAARRYASFASTITSIWDLAAGDLLLRCAGGILTDFDGLLIDYGRGPEEVSVIASWDLEVHAKMVEKLHSVRQRA
jgi:fructose-1,6-bisphosphatase/inositol monophosphatase family enzyme/transcriptional regulator with XRE-family HTH domain